MVDSGVDSEVSPSSPDEAEEADDAAATAADGGAEANAGISSCLLFRLFRLDLIMSINQATLPTPQPQQRAQQRPPK